MLATQLQAMQLYGEVETLQLQDKKITRKVPWLSFYIQLSRKLLRTQLAIAKCAKVEKLLAAWENFYE